MKNYAIISETVQNKKEIKAEIARLMDERFGKDEYTITGFEELPDNPESVSNKFRADVRFVCMHTDDDVAFWIADICAWGVPTIVIKGDTIPKDRLKTWKRILSTLTNEKTDRPLKDPNCDAMFYAISESKGNISEAIKSVAGAIMWVNNFYHALKDKAVQAESEEKLGKLLQQMGLVVSAPKRP